MIRDPETLTALLDSISRFVRERRSVRNANTLSSRRRGMANRARGHSINRII